MILKLIMLVHDTEVNYAWRSVHIQSNDLTSSVQKNGYMPDRVKSSSRFLLLVAKIPNIFDSNWIAGYHLSLCTTLLPTYFCNLTAGFQISNFNDFQAWKGEESSALKNYISL